jgi:hypothetical protein
VAVGVVSPDRDQAHPGAGCGQELRIGIGAAVVRHLEHVGGEVDVGAGQSSLCLTPEVAGEQRAHPVLGDPDHQRQVVRRHRPGRPPGIGCEHLDLRAPDRAAIAGHQGGAGAAGPADECVDGGAAVVGRRERRRGDHAHRPARQCPGQPAGVVGVEMREQYQRQRVDAEPVEAAVHRADLGPGVDEDPLPLPGGDHQRVPLAHVAGDHHG